MVVPNIPAPTGAGNYVGRVAPLKHNGQRWCALAVPDYESRALPLSYGGDGPKVTGCGSMRYSVAFSRPPPHVTHAIDGTGTACANPRNSLNDYEQP